MPEPIQLQSMRFCEVCLKHHIDLQQLADIAEVDRVVVNAMFMNVPVRSGDAEKVVFVLAERIGDHFKGIHIPLLPTFADILFSCQLNTESLAVRSGVPIHVVNQMLDDVPVPRDQARCVLQSVSEVTGRNYTLDTVDVKLQ